MWSRVLMLLLVLLAPTSSLAATVCCGQVEADSCCGSEAGCPISDDGECALAAAGETFKSALPGIELPALGPGLPETVAIAHSIFASESPPAREPARMPHYLLLETLRN
jgi:hypothetical protein